MDFTLLPQGVKQWGKKGTGFTGTVVYTFPIAFNRLLMWVSNCHDSSSTNDSPWACGGWGGTTTTLSVYSKGTDVSYIAIGEQQWGWWDNTKGTLAFTYPIAFPSTLYVITTSGINSGTVDMHISSSPKPANAGASMATTDSSYWVSCYWMAVGV